jgi:hypothetical protein
LRAGAGASAHKPADECTRSAARNGPDHGTCGRTAANKLGSALVLPDAGFLRAVDGLRAGSDSVRPAPCGDGRQIQRQLMFRDSSNRQFGGEPLGITTFPCRSVAFSATTPVNIRPGTALFASIVSSVRTRMTVPAGIVPLFI